MNLLDKQTYVRGKQFGINKHYITAYVQQCQQLNMHVYQTWQTQSQKFTCLFSQKQQYSSQLDFLLGPRKLQADIKVNPMPDPQGEWLFAGCLASSAYHMHMIHVTWISAARFTCQNTASHACMLYHYLCV